MDLLVAVTVVAMALLLLAAATAAFGTDSRDMLRDDLAPGQWSTHGGRRV